MVQTGRSAEKASSPMGEPGNSSSKAKATARAGCFLRRDWSAGFFFSVRCPSLTFVYRSVLSKTAVRHSKVSEPPAFEPPFRNFTQSKKVPAGRASRYSYQVAAQFDNRRGTGHSTDGRPRIFTFVKE